MGAVVRLAILRRRALGAWLRRVALPIAALMLCLGAWGAYYNWRTTGDPTDHPFLLHERVYAAGPQFVWLRERPVPTYRHAVMETYWRAFLGAYRAQEGLGLNLPKQADSLRRLWAFFLGGVLSFPLLALPWALRNPWMRFFAATLILGAAGLANLTFWRPPHYAAPFLAPALLLGVRCVRQARLLTLRGRPVGRRLAASLLAATGALLPFQVAALDDDRRSSWSGSRAAVAERLTLEAGEDLVLVRFAADAWDRGWVYNGADLERAPIVWARQMSAAEDCALAAHYAGRVLWDLEVVNAVDPPRLGRYSRCGDRP
jgi:hypothetical protein